MIGSYTISWQEFMETRQGTLPCPSIASFVATIFIATALGVFGVLLISFIQPQDRLVASVFCWLSLGLFLAAFWDLKIRTKKRRESAVQELRSFYSRFHADDCRFEFDKDKWTHETKAGK